MGGATPSSRQRATDWPYGRYKHYQKKLQQTAADWFGGQGCTVDKRSPYILAEWTDWPSNMIEPGIAPYVEAQRNARPAGDAFPLHKYVHHGLSSQAALFNLVVPMILRNDLSPLLQALQASGCRCPSGDLQVELEHEDRETFCEDTGQPTSIDLIVRGDDGPTLFIESKLSESEFGGCSVFACGDCDGGNPTANLSDCYLHFIGRRYWSLLDKHGFLKGPIGRDSTCIFACHYQFFRELLFALEHRGTFVLLYDDRNPTFYSAHRDGSGQLRGLMPLLEGLVPHQLKHRLKAVSFSAVLDAAAGQSMHAGWVAVFRAKYGL